MAKEVVVVGVVVFVCGEVVWVEDVKDVKNVEVEGEGE